MNQSADVIYPAPHALRIMMSQLMNIHEGFTAERSFVLRALREYKRACADLRGRLFRFVHVRSHFKHTSIVDFHYRSCSLSSRFHCIGLTNCFKGILLVEYSFYCLSKILSLLLAGNFPKCPPLTSRYRRADSFQQLDSKFVYHSVSNR